MSEEFNQIVGGIFRVAALDRLLAEVLEGSGVEGVSLGRITDDTVTLDFANRGLIDVAAFENVGDVIEDLSDTFQFGNRGAQVEVVDATTSDSISGSTGAVSAELNDLVGGTFRASRLDALLAEVIEGDGVEGVALTDFDEADDTATLAFHNAGCTDTLIATNVDFDFG